MSVLESFADERQLPLDFLERHVRIADETEPYPGWLAFDYPHRAGIWHTRYRNLDSTSDSRWRSSQGSETHLYNPFRLGPNVSNVWFCEGETDTLTLASLGLPAIGLPGASQSFRREWKLLFETAFAAVAFDADEAGAAAAAKLHAIFNPRSAIFKLPDGLDVNDWYRQDRDAMLEAIDDFRNEHNI